MGMSRRQFVASATSYGIALSLSRAAFAASPDFETRETLPGRRGWNPAAAGSGSRIPAAAAWRRLTHLGIRARGKGRPRETERDAV